jgi:hypothetical protein
MTDPNNWARHVSLELVGHVEEVAGMVEPRC